MRHTLLALLIMAAPGICGAQAMPSAPILDHARVTEATLDNGLRVIVKQQAQPGSVAVGFSIKAAPLYEAEGRHGLADVVRHFILEVPRKGQPSLGDELADLGVVFRSYTSQDATQVSALMASRALPEVLPRLVRALFEPAFEEDVWASQMPELRRRLTDAQGAPLGRLWQLVWDMAFRAHPYGRSVAGTPEGMAEFQSEDLARFHADFYVPNNVALLAVGDVNPDDFLALAAEHLGGYTRRVVEVPEVSREPRPSDTRTRLEKAAIRKTVIAYAWHAAGMDKPLDVCALDLIYAHLGMGPDARLTAALNEVEGAEAIPEVEFITKRDPGLFIIWSIANPDAEFRVREAIEAQVARLRDELLTPEDLDAARHLIHAGYAFDNKTYLGQLGAMAFYEAIDTYRFGIDYMDEVNRVTVEDIQRVARECLAPSSHTLVIIRPRSEGAPLWEARLRP